MIITTEMIVAFKHIKVEQSSTILNRIFSLSVRVHPLISAPSFRVGSTTLKEFPLPSAKKQMAASTSEILMSGCG